jgi:hypothetical protein
MIHKMTREKFEKWNKNYLIDSHMNQRLIDNHRAKDYLDSIQDTMSREFATTFLSNVQYVGHTEFISSLTKSFHTFLFSMRLPFACLMRSDKFGSDWWCTMMMYKIHQFDVLFKLNPISDPEDIIIIDDCCYSGINMFGLLDDTMNNIKTKVSKYTIHIICPFISTVARETIQEIYKMYKVKKINYYPYNVKFIEPLITSNSHPQFYEPDTTGEMFIRSNILKSLEMKDGEISALVPIYFDHKIASNMSTAGSVLNSLVYPLPTRILIEECESYCGGIQRDDNLA